MNKYDKRKQSVVVFILLCIMLCFIRNKTVSAGESSGLEVLENADNASSAVGEKDSDAIKSLNAVFFCGDKEIKGKDNVFYVNQDIKTILPKNVITKEEQEIIEKVSQSLSEEYSDKNIEYYVDDYIGVAKYKDNSFSEYRELADGKMTISQNNISDYNRQIFKFKKIASYKFSFRDEPDEIIKMVDITLYSPIYQFLFDLNSPDIVLANDINNNTIYSEDLATVIITDDVGLRSVSFYRNDKLIENIDLTNDKRIVRYEYDVALIKDSKDIDEVRVVANDLCGNEKEYIFYYNVDSSAPCISCIGISDGVVYADKVSLLVSAEDNSDITSVFYKVDYTDVFSGTRCLESFTREYAGIAEISREYDEEGIYDVTMFAYDSNGNYSKTLRYSFGIDTKSPIVSIENIAEGEIYNVPVSASANVNEIFYEGVSVSFEGTVEDLSGPRNIELAPYDVKAKANRNIVEFSNEGKYRLSLKASDIAGHSSQVSKEFVIDRSAPRVEIIVDGDYVSGNGKEGVSSVLRRVPDIIVNACDDYSEYSVTSSVYVKEKDGSFKLDNTSNYVSVGKTTSFDTSLPGEGEYMVRVVAKDVAGNMSEKSISILIDENPPVIGYLSDFNEKYLNEFKLPKNLRKYIQDATNVRYRAYLNSKEINSCDIKKDGKYLLQVVAEDEAGNRSEQVAAFIVDNTKPKIIVGGIDDEGRIAKNGIISLSLFDEEDFFTEAFVNGKNVDIEGDGKEILVKAVDYGDYDISVVASDYAGNKITQVVKTSCALSANPFTIKINSDDIKTLTKNDDEIHETFFDKIQGKKFGVFCGFVFVVDLFFLGFALFDIERMRR